METIKVLFVCMGNICRSPTAQGVFEKLLGEQDLAGRIEVDSAGTHAWHVGEAPDVRATRAAQRRGVDLSRLKARRVSVSDIESYDYVLAMDEGNYDMLAELCSSDQPGQLEKIRLFMEFAPDARIREVPDPYYGGATGFERVLDLIEAASNGLLDTIRRDHGI